MPPRNWLITGASSGFGRIMAEQLLARGARVAGTVRNLSVMDELKAKYGSQLWLAKLDLSETATIRGSVDLAFAALGHIDVVVSNAGYGLMGAAEEMTDEQVRHQIDTNLVGSIQLIRAALPHLRGSCSCPAWAARWPSPVARSITRPNGASRASSTPLHKKWKASGSAAP
jgi:NAD(P)-dependent dehydrogenase (short-subunit alcohol dehydrogenase family)